MMRRRPPRPSAAAAARAADLFRPLAPAPGTSPNPPGQHDPGSPAGISADRRKLGPPAGRLPYMPLPAPAPHQAPDEA